MNTIRNLPVRFAASTEVDKSGIETMKGRSYANKLASSVNKYKMEFDELPKEVSSVRFFNQYTGTRGSGPLFFLELIADALSGPPYKPETSVEASFKGEFSILETEPLKFDFPYQKLTHWFPTKPMNEAVEKVLDTIRNHVPVVRARQQKDRELIMNAMTEHLADATRKKAEAEEKLKRFTPQLEAANTARAQETENEKRLNQQIGESKSTLHRLQLELMQLSETEQETGELMSAMSTRPDVLKDELLTAIRNHTKAKADVKKQNAAIHETNQQIAGLETDLKASRKQQQQKNSDYYSIQREIESANYAIQKQSSVIEHTQEQKTKFQEYLNGTRQLTEQERWDYSTICRDAKQKK